jgi:hypothetical protein
LGADPPKNNKIMIGETFQIYAEHHEKYKELLYITLDNNFRNYPTNNKNRKKGKKYKSLKSRANRRK